MSTSAEKELIGVSHEWDRAMVANDSEAIGQYMADDWIIIEDAKHSEGIY